MEEEGVDMMVLVGGVAGGFLVLIIAIVIVCILMRNILRNSAKKAAENAERLAKTTNPDTVSIHEHIDIIFWSPKKTRTSSECLNGILELISQ